MRGRSARLRRGGNNNANHPAAACRHDDRRSGAANAQERTRSLVKYDTVEIDLIAEGRGPLIVLLPSRGRDLEDYDEVAAGLAREGFRVLRPQPRGMHASKGPLKDITLHDLARDIAT